MGLLTLLTQPAMARAMGSAAASRAREMFAPDKVMHSHEILFSELNEIRVAASEDAHMPSRLAPRLIL